MDQAFRHTGWSERVDTPVGGTPQQVIENAVSCSSDFDQTQALEFRFSNSAGTFTAVAQQALESGTSDGTAEVALFVDGRQVQTQQLGFKDKRTFSTPLTGVNAIKIVVREIYGKGSNCPGQVTLVISNLSIA